VFRTVSGWIMRKKIYKKSEGKISAYVGRSMVPHRTDYYIIKKELLPAF
jgi:hypothetical protein